MTQTINISNLPKNEFTPDLATQRLYRDALGKFTTGITVVSTESEGSPIGFTANSFTSVSLQPPLVLWSIAKQSNRHRAFTTTNYMAIHVLSEAQQHLSNRFAKAKASFEGLNWCRNDHNVPLIDGCVARFECKRYAVYEGGDHDIIVCQVENVSLCSHHNPLVYAEGKYAALEKSGSIDVESRKQAS